MTDALIHGATWAATWCVQYVVHSTLLFVAAWTVCRTVREISPVYREFVWKSTALGSLATAALSTLLIHAAPPPSEPAAAAPTAVRFLESGEAVPDGAVLVDLGLVHEPSSAETDSLPPGNAIVPPTFVVRLAPWLGIACGLLTCGSAAAGLAWTVLQNCCFSRRLRSCPAVTSGMARRVLDDLCRRSGVKRRIRLAVSPTRSEPAAFGWRRWSILLPPRALQLPEDELRGLLGHELGHLVRGDTVWVFLGRLLCACFWYQPLNRRARREWQAAAELLTDEWAVRSTGDRLALARCLTEVAGWQLCGAPAAASLTAEGSRSELTDRIVRLVDIATAPEGPPRRRWTGWARWTAAGGIAAGLLAVSPNTGFTWVDAAALSAELREESTQDGGEDDTWEELDRELDALRRELAELEAEAAASEHHDPRRALRMHRVQRRFGEVVRLREELRAGWSAAERRKR